MDLGAVEMVMQLGQLQMKSGEVIDQGHPLPQYSIVSRGQEEHRHHLRDDALELVVLSTPFGRIHGYPSSGSFS